MKDNVAPLGKTEVSVSCSGKQVFETAEHEPQPGLHKPSNPILAIAAF